MKRYLGPMAGALLLVTAACGDSSTPPTVADAPPTSQATTVEPVTSPPATTVAPTTAAATTAPVGPPEALGIPRLDNGLPATFVAVTEGWEAVEVDTATGAIIRSIARVELPGEADDEAGIWAAVQQVWRSSDHQWFVVAECCEPAAGMIHYLEPDTVLTPENHDETIISDGWSVAPSPFDDRLARLGYNLRVAPVGGDSSVDLWFDQPGGPAQPTGSPAWGLSGDTISWITNNWGDDGGASLSHLDVTTTGAMPTEIELDWLEPDQWLDGMGTQRSGNHVAFRNTSIPDAEGPAIIKTEGVVFSPDGGLVATFPVETGSYWGGYDPSGRMLIYTDADNAVRWQGLGQKGTLAEGFIHASW